MSDKKMKLNFQISQEFKDFLETQSKKMGISISALINIAIAQYRDQQLALNSLPGIFEVMSKLQNMQSIGQSSEQMELERIRQDFKDKKKSPVTLMTEMEVLFNIPVKNDKKFNAENADVMKLYSEIAESREL